MIIINGNNVIVITGDANLKSTIYDTKKVYRIISKPINNYQLEQAINDFKKEQLLDAFPVKECQIMLFQLNINPYTRTGKTLTEIIHICYSDIDMLDNLNSIYRIIGNKYSFSPKKVKECLRSSINTINRFQNEQLLHKIFYLEDENNLYISPKRFISGFVTYLNNR